MMRLTKSQTEVRERILTPARGGLSTDLIWAQYSAGCTSLLHALSAETQSGSGVRVASQGVRYGDYDALDKLGDRFKIKLTRPSTFISKLIRFLSDEGQRPVALVFDESHFLKPRQMERLLLACEDAAHECGARLRTMFIVKEFYYWQRKKVNVGKTEIETGEWERTFDFPRITPLFKTRLDAGRLQTLNLNKETFDVLTRRESREEIDRLVSVAS